MTVNNIDFSILEKIPNNAIQFFKAFMRMEYALKEAGYLKNRKRPNQKDCNQDTESRKP